MAGTLYIVATPIGNLEDITHRARRLLAEVDAVACEDTRVTGKLLAHFGISKPLLAYYEPKEERLAEPILARLAAGASIALCTDAGTPTLSDPGYRLITRALAAGAAVEPVPGPCAAVAALSASGLPTDRFTFVGFLSPKGGKRRAQLAELRERRDTLVLYLSPHRAVKELDDCLEVLGDREAVLFRELTKLHEERVAGPLSVIRERVGEGVKGELTLIVRGAAAASG